MVLITRFLGGRSSKGFVKQQIDLGALNGYVEEMLEGQKVVKVFNHEDEAKHEFDTVNERLCKTATKALVIYEISPKNTLVPKGKMLQTVSNTLRYFWILIF